MSKNLNMFSNWSDADLEYLSVIFVRSDVRESERKQRLENAIAVEKTKRIDAENTVGRLKRAMRRWSNKKVEMELFFAEEFNDGSHESKLWLQACEAESESRETTSAVAA